MKFMKVMRDSLMIVAAAMGGAVYEATITYIKGLSPGMRFPAAIIGIIVTVLIVGFILTLLYGAFGDD